MKPARDFHICLPGDPAFAALVVRLFQEVGPLPDGPGQEEIDRLTPALERLVIKLLSGLRDEGAGRSLRLVLTPDPGGLDLSLTVSPVRGGTSLLGEDDPVLADLDTAFTGVRTAPGDEGALEIHLTFTSE